jgi:hypothetical protein
MAGALAICVALSSLLAFAGASVFIYSRIIKEGWVNSFLRARSYNPVVTACTSKETRKGKYRGASKERIAKSLKLLPLHFLTFPNGETSCCRAMILSPSFSLRT